MCVRICTIYGRTYHDALTRTADIDLLVFHSSLILYTYMLPKKGLPKCRQVRRNAYIGIYSIPSSSACDKSSNTLSYCTHTYIYYIIYNVSF